MKKNFTGWLILLMVILGPLQFGGAARSLSSVSDTFRPYLADYPSLSTAIMVYQFLIGTSIAVWVYTAWILFRRERGTLKTAQTTFLVGAALRIIGSFSIIVFGGLPPDFTRGMIQRTVPATAASVVMLAAWYFYLVRSQRVQDIYAA